MLPKIGARFSSASKRLPERDLANWIVRLPLAIDVTPQGHRVQLAISEVRASDEGEYIAVELEFDLSQETIAESRTFYLWVQPKGHRVEFVSANVRVTDCSKGIYMVFTFIIPECKAKVRLCVPWSLEYVMQLG